MRRSVHVDDFRADPTGRDPSTQSVRDAIKVAVSIGVTDVCFSAGIYLLDNPGPPATHWDNEAAISVQHDGIRLVGAGRMATILKLSSQANGNVIKFGARSGAPRAVTGGGVCGLSIDGNRECQRQPTAGDYHWQGIDVASGSSHITLSDLYLHDCQYYGIGMQRDRIRHCTVRDVVIERTGADGLDWKDDTASNYGNTIANLHVSQFGLAGLPMQAGVDLRGGVDASNIWVQDFAGDTTGIRVRVQAASTYATRLRGFRIAPGVIANTRGLWAHASGALNDNLIVSDGEIIGGQVGARLGYVQGLAGNLRIIEAETALQMYARNMVTGVSIEHCGTGIDIEHSGNALSTALVRGCSTGLRVRQGAKMNVLSGGQFQGNSVDVEDHGNGIAIYGVPGLQSAA